MTCRTFSIIVQALLMMIVINIHHIFTVQATGWSLTTYLTIILTVRALWSFRGHYSIQHNDTQHYYVAMLSVANKPSVLSVILKNVVVPF
jgi:hypothetical protein